VPDFDRVRALAADSHIVVRGRDVAADVVMLDLQLSPADGVAATRVASLR